MADRYLFRGKKRGNKEWIVGDLLTVSEVDIRIAEYHRRQFQVDRLTVGQYTGIRDKNGRLVFEGDIVRAKGVAGEEVIEPVRYVGYEYQPFDYIGLTDFEIIGNIHDNPELIERGNDEQA